ncbi:uridine diphosphate glucose pyrophosphatase NUDT14-like [Chelonus insularis]|uniref:uridine diphosphate glucose pyrophosphatase NUDT14-like n=1 Tax=Chelonus insularis TaxID=460826 RepID=UPI00158D2B8B|nr:uridine diphosphate glucose pyrophosphatase NUDT14-like [Chelonus insularis]
MTDKGQEERNAIIRQKMLDMKNIRIEKMPMDSPWLRPARMSFRQNGEDKAWDLSRIHDSVAIIVFNISRKKLIFVRQFRPAAYYATLPEKFQEVDIKNYPLETGLTLELCAGIIDKNATLAEIASIELREECGYEVPPTAFTEIVTYRDVGSTVGKHTLFYVEVSDEMHIHPGGGAESEGELIEVVEMSPEEANNYIASGDVQSPPTFLYGVLWFLTAKKDRYC